MKLITLFLVLLSIQNTFAAGGEHHGESGVPIVVLYQAINVGVIAIGLYFMLRKGIAAYFKEKRETFLLASRRAEEAIKTAEKEHENIRIQLTKLEASQQDTIARAQAEAAEMRDRIIEDARLLSKRMREEAEQNAKLEIEKAKNSLREQLIQDSVQAAKQALKEQVSSEDQKKLQNEFMANIKAVNP